ncbi:MAG TPA: type II toxin-antitoxin system RelE/ParE family toxin [Candidatus Limnocylindria bacterium]|nr:type II toxin-antitoxin system RelE/ParE family toxin [Candidatus Limnocylindria bacterium]
MADDDLKTIPAEARTRIARAIQARLTTAPERYGVRLTGTLRGYWKLRIGDYRVVFKITSADVLILAILHRRQVYERALRRTE